MDKLIDNFVDWVARSGTHNQRTMVLINKHRDNLNAYIKLFETLPINSLEFKNRVQDLLTNLSQICEDFSDNFNDVGKDCTELQDIFIQFKEAIDRLPEK